VDSLDIEPTVADTDFLIEEKPGMLVKTGVYPVDDDPSKTAPEPTNVHRYRIDGDGKRREVVFENGVEKRVGRPSWLWWIVGTLVVAGITALLYLVGRRPHRPPEQHAYEGRIDRGIGP